MVDLCESINIWLIYGFSVSLLPDCDLSTTDRQQSRKKNTSWFSLLTVQHFQRNNMLMHRTKLFSKLLSCNSIFGTHSNGLGIWWDFYLTSLLFCFLLLDHFLYAILRRSRDEVLCGMLHIFEIFKTVSVRVKQNPCLTGLRPDKWSRWILLFDS